MDNQGTSSFNQQPTSDQNANFWDPTAPTYGSASPSGFSGQPNPQFSPQPSNQFASSPTYPNSFNQQSTQFNTFSPNNQSSNLLNKNFIQMTDQEKKEAERIARAKNRVDLLKTIGLIVVSLLAILFVGLFIWMTIKWSEANTNVQGKIDVAVAQAKNELQTKLENEFEEKEKYPYLTFAGPADLGSLSFEYPKTWSLYNSEDASRGGDYNAYLNPGQVNVVDDRTVMALRVSIKDELIDRVLENYTYKIESGEMTVSSTIVNGISVSVYTGKLDSGLQGIVCIFKIRDKTAVLQTDSKTVFKPDFERILSTIRFNS